MDWNNIGRILNKDSSECLFKIFGMQISNKQTKNWSLQEDQLLIQIVKYLFPIYIQFLLKTQIFLIIKFLIKIHFLAKIKRKRKSFDGLKFLENFIKDHLKFQHFVAISCVENVG